MSTTAARMMSFSGRHRPKDAVISGGSSLFTLQATLAARHVLVSRSLLYHLSLGPKCRHSPTGRSLHFSSGARDKAAFPTAPGSAGKKLTARTAAVPSGDGIDVSDRPLMEFLRGVRYFECQPSI